MKGLKTYLIAGGILLTIYIIAEFNRPKVIDWTETLNVKDKKPFGAYILFNRLHDIFPGSQITPYRQAVYNVIAEDSAKNSSYIIIAPEIDLSKTDYEQLLKYIKAGNDVFIASEYFGSLLGKKLNVKTNTYFKLNNSGTPVNFLNPALHPEKYFNVDKGTGNIYFDKFDTLKAIALGGNKNHKANFVKYPFGKGALYLLANPRFFGNYSLFKKDGAQYASTALSYVKNTKVILWDEYYTQGEGDEDSPMKVFFNNRSLQWAYYIAIFSLLTFVLFEIKRRQRVIPVIEPLKNSTLEFVNVVGQVYYERRNNANIAHKKVLYLLEHLREVYQLKTNKLDEEFTEKLAAKLGVELKLAADLVNYITYIDNQTTVNDRELIKLNQLIEQLYSQVT